MKNCTTLKIYLSSNRTNVFIKYKKLYSLFLSFLNESIKKKNIYFLDS